MNEELTFWKIWSNFGAEAVCNETGDTPMKDFEEETVTALRNLFDKVNSLWLRSNALPVRAYISRLT